MKIQAALMLAAVGSISLCAWAQESKEPGAKLEGVKQKAPAVASTPGLTEVVSLRDTLITGVAVSSTGRVFVCAPFWREGHTWSVAEVKPDGSVEPFPPGNYNRWTPGEGLQLGVGFVCVQSVFCDEEDHLWVLDAGSPKMEGVLRGDDSGGGAKLVRINLKTNRVVRPYILGGNVVPRDGYVNDVRIDLANNLAYITESGTGGIILLDLRHGRARRIGDSTPSTKADASVKPVVGGRPLVKRDGSAFFVHADGIAFDKKNGWLYYQALTGNRLHRVRTKALQSIMVGANDRLDERVAEATEDLGETVVTDGMEIDDAGNVYFTAIEKNAIMYRSPDGKLHTLVSGDEIRWPDSIAIRNGELYFTTSQIHLTDWFSEDGSNPKEPYKVYKVKLPAGAVAAPKVPG